MGMKHLIILILIGWNPLQARPIVDTVPAEVTPVISCDFSRRLDPFDSSGTKLFEQALTEMEAKGNTTLSILLPYYEAHLVLTQKADGLELRLNRPTRLTPRPDVPRIQNDLALWIVHHLREGLNAREYNFKKYTLSLDGMISKESLRTEISQNCALAAKPGNEKSIRDVAYLATLGTGLLNPIQNPKRLEISIP